MEHKIGSLDAAMAASASQKEKESARDLSNLPLQAEDMKFTDQQTAATLGARPNDYSVGHMHNPELHSEQPKETHAEELPLEKSDLKFVDQQSAASVEAKESHHAMQEVGNPALGRDDNQLGHAGDFPLERNMPDATDDQGAVTIGTKDAEKRFATDDAAFRDHWETTYGQSAGHYEDYDAAYRYGTQAGDTDRYRNHHWESAEPHLRSDWEKDHPESTWEKVKDAVRYGIERVKGGMGLH